MISRLARIEGFSVIAFFLSSVLAMLLLLLSARLALCVYNIELTFELSRSDLLTSFLLGTRFDLSAIGYACLPITLLGFSNGNGCRRCCVWWLWMFSSLFIFCSLIELEFYKEFQQRLNSLAFIYLREDPKTVLSMIWFGYPVMQFLLAWMLLSMLMLRVFLKLEQLTRSDHSTRRSLPQRSAMTIFLLLVSLSMGRGSISSGAPLRWGDAYHGSHLFANHLTLNGTKTLFKALLDDVASNKENQWLKSMPPDKAISLVRKILLTSQDELLDPTIATIRRWHTPPTNGSNRIQNIVIILMESFSGQFVGALGNSLGVTPHFDRLAKKGLLFKRTFSNGTHTHQGIFATLSCFPNLPGFEYLMQQPEGRNQFSGVAGILGTGQFEDLFIYNGDFRWDNQEGFFRNQGMSHFIGREDFVNPRLVSSTWGVSDEDMFSRALVELRRLTRNQPFFAVLQTLSNHPPYTLPDPLPFEPVIYQGEVSERLTATKYADWALGQFFDAIDQEAWKNDTLFVILGDHGFVVDNLLTDINLLRFHVPLLFLAPGLQDTYGASRETVATQVDVIPTSLGILGKPFRHQCWGRNLLNLPANDQGFAFIKPSGDEQIVAMIRGDRILTMEMELGARLYQYRLQPDPTASPLSEPKIMQAMQRQLLAYVQAATESLYNNSGGY